MKRNIIVLKNENEESDCMYITSKDNFSKRRYCECYNSDGILIGCYNACCYALDNSASTAMEDCKNEICVKFNLEFNDFDIVYHKSKFIIEFRNKEKEINEDEINKFIENWKDENENHTSATAWIYWDGNNFKTIFLDIEYNDLKDFVEVDEDIAKNVLIEFKGTAAISSGAYGSYSGEKYTFISSLYANDPFICKVTKK